ncbi:MAG: DUF1415 domain-containing protein [Burkholderiales bacterium]|nr:DUF1415 domain-containing protein [Burkholderiales bacterium]
MSDATAPSDEEVVAATRRWLERAVIGLNLCPFANAVHIKGQIRYVVSQARTPAELTRALKEELRTLADADPQACDTTLLIHPHVLADFLDYNDFLDDADAAVEELELDGVLQVASFHPHYRFEGVDPDDITNYSNRSPYPTLHLLREESIDRAVEAFPSAERIYEANMETLRRLGVDGWREINSAVTAVPKEK